MRTTCSRSPLGPGHTAATPHYRRRRIVLVMRNSALRAHLPLRQRHPRLDHPSGVHPRTSRPLDLANRRRLHPAPPRPRPRRRPPPTLGTPPSIITSHTLAGPKRVSPTAHNHRHAGPSTEIHQGRTRATQRHPTTTTNPLPSGQEGCLTAPPRFNRKLRSGRGTRAPFEAPVHVSGRT